MSGADQRALNTLISATVTNEKTFNSAMDTIPLNNYSGSSFPTDTTAANYDLIKSVDVVQQSDQLNFSILSNTDSAGAIVKASIKSGQLDLLPVSQGTATIVIQAKDKAGNTANVTYNVKVGPVIVTNPGSQTNLDTDVMDLPITAESTTGQTLTYSATGLPTGLTINSTSGHITGTIAVGAHTASPYNVMVTATDGTGHQGTATFKWTVNPVITVQQTLSQTNKVGDMVSLQVTATDAKSLTLTYSAQNLPAGLTIDSAKGLISGQIATGANSSIPYNVVVTVSDGTSSTADPFAWTVGT
jgi:hypothetical protein